MIDYCLGLSDDQISLFLSCCQNAGDGWIGTQININALGSVDCSLVDRMLQIIKMVLVDLVGMIEVDLGDVIGYVKKVGEDLFAMVVCLDCRIN